MFDKPCTENNHKFEARYDIIPPVFKSFKGDNDAIILLTKKIYVQDICKKCGKTIKRKEK